MSANGNGAVTGPDSFAFTAANEKAAKKIIGKYPKGREASAVMPLLDLAQRQSDGWLPRVAIEYVAAMLNMPPMRVLEVASFYTMYNLEPVGRNHVQVCTNLPCWLRGADEVVGACRKTLGVDLGGSSEDGEFTLSEAECLGACVNAPMMQINDDYYEDLDADSTKAILEALKRGEKPEAGPQTPRQSSEPLGGRTTLLGEGGDG